MPKVFIINASGHDYSPAKEFGEIVPLTEGAISKYRLTSMYRDMSKPLENSSPDDYILMCGPSVMQAVACAIFASIHNRLNLLLFKTGDEGEKGKDIYILRRLNLELLKKGS